MGRDRPDEPNPNDFLGVRGEALFLATMTSFHGGMPLFRVHFLGDKWPTVDFVCELEGTWQRHRPFFFAQVKATRRGYTAAGRLRIAVTEAKARALARFKAPVYLVGIDEIHERAYIVGVTGSGVGALASLHCGAELDAAGRRALWQDVRRYWSRVPRLRNWTRLREPSWR